MGPDLLHALAAAVVLRDAGGAAGFGAVWSLFAGAAVLAWRRRILTSVLQHPSSRRSDPRNPA